VFALVVILDQNVGGGTGTSLLGLNRYDPAQRRNYTWLTLAFTVLMLGSSSGCCAAAPRHAAGGRDDEEAASGRRRVVTNKRILFVVAAVGCGPRGR
jgi:branched-chain amino acid transport system permease protein